MKLKKVDAIKMLDTIKIGVPSKDDEANVLFCGSDAVSHNGIVWVHFPFETEFSCIVKAKVFEQALRSTAQEEVDVDMQENTLLLRTEDMEADIAVSENMDAFGALETVQSEISNKEWDELPKNFSEGIELCRHSISENPAHQTHRTLFISHNDILSTDRVRCSHYTLDSPFPGEAMYLKRTVPFISRFLPNYCINLKNRTHFADENGVVLTVQKISGEYDDKGPRWIFDIVNDKWKVTKLPEELKAILDNMTEFFGGETKEKKHMTFIFESSRILLASEEEGKSKIKKIIKYETGHESKFEFGLNPNLLRQYLEFSNEILISTEEKHRFVLLRKENFQHMIAMFLTV